MDGCGLAQNNTARRLVNIPPSFATSMNGFPNTIPMLVPTLNSWPCDLWQQRLSALRLS